MTPSQSVLDALADAETLRLFFEDAAPDTERGVRGAFVNAYRASDHGDEAVKQMGWAWGLRRGLADGASHHATLAARAAFRAVPGLRGTE